MAFTTKKSLLIRVKNGDEISYEEFYRVYRPLVWLVGGDCLLSNEEREDLIQEVMLVIFGSDADKGALFKYDSSKGRFRDYFKAIIRNLALNIVRQRKNMASLDDDGMPEPISEENFNAQWDDEWRKLVMNQAMEELRNRVKSSTFAAFEMYAVQGRAVGEVAETLEMSVNAIYIAKNRCLEELKQIIANLESK